MCAGSTITESPELVSSMLEKMNQMQTNSTWRHEPASSHSNSKVTSRQEPPELSLVFRELIPLACLRLAEWRHSAEHPMRGLADGTIGQSQRNEDCLWGMLGP